MTVNKIEKCKIFKLLPVSSRWGIGVGQGISEPSLRESVERIFKPASRSPFPPRHKSDVAKDAVHHRVEELTSIVTSPTYLFLYISLVYCKGNVPCRVKLYLMHVLVQCICRTLCPCLF